MRLSYNKLWKLLIDKGWTKEQLRTAAGFSPATLAKLGRGDNIQTNIIVRICETLACQPADIIEIKGDN